MVVLFRANIQCLNLLRDLTLSFYNSYCARLKFGQTSFCLLRERIERALDGTL